MRAIQLEKYDQADTAFMMYENALRKTDKVMDEQKPEEPKDLLTDKLLAKMNGKFKNFSDA